MDYAQNLVKKLFADLPSKPRAVQGQWSQIRLSPDLTSGEQLAVGVFLVVEDKVHSRFITDFSRIEYAYDLSMVECFKFCIELIEFALERGHRSSLSPQIIIDHRGYSQGDSVDEILDHLMSVAVPLSKAIKNPP